MNSSVAIEDITDKKKDIEAKLEAERQNLTWLTETLNRSSQLAGNMCSILDAFEDHLCKLEDTILPIHKETMDLQRRQGNIDKTLTLLDEVLNYHNVSSSVRKIIDDGPTGFLDDYLKSMERVEDAVRFFKVNNPDSIELSLLNELNESGREMLSKEFRTLLTRHSKPVPTVTIYDMLNVMMAEMSSTDDTSQTSFDDSNIDHLPERTMIELKTIANWLTAHGTNKDFMSVYSQVRSTALKLSLQGIKDGGTSSQTQISAAGRGKATPVAINPKRPTRIRREGRKGSTKSLDNAHKRAPLYQATESSLVEEEENSEVTRFITCTGALLKLMQSERTLLQAIIPEKHQVPIFSHLLNETIQMHINDGEALCNSAKKFFNKLDHSSIQIIFPVLKYLRSLSQDFDTVLRTANVEARKKFFTLFSLFESTGYKAMYEFIEKLKETEKHITMPKDGTVHEVTTNVMVFLEDLVKFSETTGIILASKEETGTRLSNKDHEKFVANYISQALICLSRSLALKAKSYDTIGLQSIFMLNNYNYIIKSLEKTGLMLILKKHGFPDIESEYRETMQEETKLYEKSWNKVINHLLEVNAPLSQEKLAEALSKGHLKDKYKQGIKEKFKGFNADFDDLKQVHKVYAMPDPELRESLYKKMSDFVVPLYSTFLLRYRDVNFTKNPEKYIKYSLDDFERNLIAMYEVGGKHDE